MPSMMGKAKAKERLLSTLPDEFRKVAQQANVPLNDFPNPYEYAQTLATYDLSKLPKASKETLQLYEDVIERDLPGIMQHFTSTPGAPPPSASSLQPDGELRGWLHKQATSGKWQRRYFALREGTLEYYRRPEEPKPSGALDLAGCRAKPRPESDRPFTIRIETRERPYHLAAASGDEMSEWLLCLQHHCSRGESG
mmetsp:Transcript_10866/g.29640  ORF Transcript_10866/g.29640 Transcript_10866/m.29640 type:complete len:196 (+) Transcript_10866:179-766(+)